MIENRNKPAMPVRFDPHFHAVNGRANPTDYDGITKREYFAGVALSGLLSSNSHQVNPLDDDSFQFVSELAIKWADTLLKSMETKD